MKKIDIVDIREMVNLGLLTSYVKDDTIYLKNSIGECVAIGTTKEAEKCGDIDCIHRNICKLTKTHFTCGYYVPKEGYKC